MSTDPYTARLRLEPRYAPYLPEIGAAASVLVVGYHAAFAATPAHGTPITAFDPAPPRHPDPPMALIRIEHRTASLRTDADGNPQWQPDPFGIGLPEFCWYLTPTQHTGTRWVLARGRWAAGGRQAVLPRTLTAAVPGAPTVVSVHDHNTHTGRRWNQP
ncbi:hypothetical protein [Nocardia sp. CNY236]|uniref:hypothetical protein n=1 Tax=Nocardia sp. CNY236 TaxID=1169152 RepID=UPI0003FD7AE1|nr:hypothetical protein [Nocardia sp. CNY236]